MIFKNKNKIEVLKTEQAAGYRLAETKLNEIVELELEPQGVVAAHALPRNVVFYVISGSGIITIDDESIIAQVGDIMEVQANAQRGWLNNGDDILKLLVIKEKA